MAVCVLPCWKVHFEVDLGVRYLFEWSKCDTSCDFSVVFSVRLQQVLWFKPASVPIIFVFL